MENISAKKIWKERWQESFDKFNRAVELTGKEVPFCNKRGFDSLVMVGRCGYCKEYDSDGKGCAKCTLFQRKICSSYKSGNRNAIFLQYVREMQKGIRDSSKVDWELALLLITTMRDVIERDRPH